MGAAPPDGYVQVWRRASRVVILAAMGTSLVTACVSTPPLYEPEAQPPPEEATLPDSTATYTPQPSLDGSSTDAAPSPADASFQFPQASCGDQSSESGGVWYAVVLEGTTVEEVRSRYCGDAISTTRADSGTPTVQVASFTSYARALSLAQLVGGTVEQTSAPSASSPVPHSDYQSADQATPPASPNPEPTVPTGSTAVLMAQNPATPINIRASASTAAPIQTTGYTGDAVQISRTTQGDDGYTWYEIQLDSGLVGWVRGDLVTDAASAPPAQLQPAYPETPPAAAAPPPAPPPDRPYNPPYSVHPPAASPPTRLTARDPGSSINVREAASLNARIRYIGYPGDLVRIASSARGDDGYTWYQVQFETGTVGWVRSDFVGSY
ncbi:MAG: SH3 domain-containing protein [Synechococcales cyanobacterium M58_A2018_015]|nr:SH3 domain-containing protein [Synechococcales cyanobacterium M58_A2018_015]